MSPIPAPVVRWMGHIRWCLVAACLCAMSPAVAQGPAPAPRIETCNSGRVSAAVRNRARLATYYDLNLALLDGRVFQWRGNELPRRVFDGAEHVTVAMDIAYAVDREGRLVRWPADRIQPETILEQVTIASAGRTGVLAIRCDGTLWRLSTGTSVWELVSDNVVHAWVGDGADYYIDHRGRLHVTGLADRGQYGDGTNVRVNGWKRVSDRAARVVAHMGHALYLNFDGIVMGTGSNVDGALGDLAFGDKAEKWGKVFEPATDVTTGLRHSAAIRGDGSLWVWGGEFGPAPRQVMKDVVETAAGEAHTLALTTDWKVFVVRGREPPREVRFTE